MQNYFSNNCLNKGLLAIAIVFGLFNSNLMNAQSSSNGKIVLERGHPAKKHLFTFTMRLKESERLVKKNLPPKTKAIEEAREEFDKAKALAPNENWKPYEDRLIAIESSFNVKKEEKIVERKQQVSNSNKKEKLKDYIRDIASSKNGDYDKKLPRVSGNIYEEIAKKADWKAYQSLDDMGKNASIFDVGTEADFIKNYPDFVSKVIVPEAYKQLDKTNDGNLGEAMEAAQNALGYANGVLIFLPSNSEMVTIKTQAKSKINSLSSKLSKELSGPFHTSNIGNLLLSNKKINLGNESEADFKTSFNAEESVYLISYWRQSIKKETSGSKDHPNGLDGIDAVGLNLSIGDETRGLYVKIPTLGDNNGQSSVVQVCLTPSLASINADKYDYIQIQAFIKLFSHLKSLGARKHEVKISFGEESSKFNKGSVPFFKTSFSLVGNPEYYQKALDKSKEVLIDATRIPKKGASNPDAEAKGEAFVQTENGSVLRIHTSEGWYIEKNNRGIPLRKWNRMYAAYKGSDGRCYYRPLRAEREYSGGGNYESITITGGKSIPINCKNINK